MLKKIKHCDQPKDIFLGRTVQGRGGGELSYGEGGGGGGGVVWMVEELTRKDCPRGFVLFPFFIYVFI